MKLCSNDILCAKKSISFFLSPLYGPADLFKSKNIDELFYKVLRQLHVLELLEIKQSSDFFNLKGNTGHNTNVFYCICNILFTKYYLELVDVVGEKNEHNYCIYTK